MPRVITHGNYAVFVLSERGGRHHLPHAHIKLGGQRVASVFLLTLDVFDDVQRLPPELLAEIARNQETLLEKWEELNRE